MVREGGGLVRLPLVLERFDVEVRDSQLGLRLCQLESGAVVLLADAVLDGRELRVGDALLCINEIPIELLKYDAVLARLRDAPRPMSLSLGRTEPAVAEQVHSRALLVASKARQQQERARQLEMQATSSSSAAGAGAGTTATSGGEERGAARLLPSTTSSLSGSGTSVSGLTRGGILSMLSGAATAVASGLSSRANAASAASVGERAKPLYTAADMRTTSSRSAQCRVVFLVALGVLGLMLFSEDAWALNQPFELQEMEAGLAEVVTVTTLPGGGLRGDGKAAVPLPPGTSPG
jgi:hypothetical protein